LKTALFTVLAPGTVALYAPYWILSSRGQAHLERIGALQVLSFPLMAVGVAGYFWCAWNFAVAGRGTPSIIDPPKILVALGPYQFVRNPMYVSVTLLLLGEELLFESSALAAYALAFWAVTCLFVLLYEEPHLRRKFGASYQEYCRAVRRWIPRLPRAGTKNRNHAI
jgi:protein-S-isoprenylcysteine O-methyltransferase Ste14